MSTSASVRAQINGAHVHSRIEQKRIFQETIEDVLSNQKGIQQGLMSGNKYNEIISVLKTWSTRSSSTNREHNQAEYRYSGKYYLPSRNGGDIALFIKQRKNGSESSLLKSVVHRGKVFEHLEDAHVSINHGNGEALQSVVKERHGKSIPNWIRKVFTYLYPTCIQTRQVHKHQRAGHKPILSKAYGERRKADLIDFQNAQFNGYKYLLVFQDHLIRFVECAPLPDKRSRTISCALLQIFTTLGAPRLLHMDNGRELTNLALESYRICSEPIDVDETIGELKMLWPKCSMIHGRARHSESQAIAERGSRKFREHIRTWLVTNAGNECRNNWPTAALFAKWAINSSYHGGIRTKPYRLVFGQNPMVGIIDLPLLTEDLAGAIVTEADLARFYGADENALLENVVPNVTDARTVDKLANEDEYEQNGYDMEPEQINVEMEPERLVGSTENRENRIQETLPVLFCKDCNRRKIREGEVISSAHLSCGGDEAYCNCDDSDQGTVSAVDLIENGSRDQSSAHATQGNVNMHTGIEDLQVQAVSEKGTGVSAEENANATHDFSNTDELMTSEFCSRCKRRRFREEESAASMHLNYRSAEAYCFCHVAQGENVIEERLRNSVDIAACEAR